MAETIERYFRHTDDRGSIEGLVNFGDWKELNLITSQAGTVRGHHYHKRTQELFIILDGEIEVTIQKVVDGRLCEDVQRRIVTAGDVFMVLPYEHHVFSLIKDSRWINVLSQNMDQGDPDIHRIVQL